MKKIFTLCFLSAALLSQAEPSIVILGDGAELQGLAISRNGRYVVGCTYDNVMFASDWASGNLLIGGENTTVVNGSELRHVSNTGLGVGLNESMGVTYDIPNGGVETQLTLLDGFLWSLAEDITADGGLIVGVMAQEEYGFKQACVWRDGEPELLPLPTEEELGFPVSGSSATFVSDDGSVIAGYVVDDLGSYPFVLWLRQDDGSYVCDMACKGLFEPCLGSVEDYMDINIDLDPADFATQEEYEAAYQEEWNTQYWAQYQEASDKLAATWTNPYLMITPSCLSGNGNMVGLCVCANVDGWPSEERVAIYDLESRKITEYEAGADFGSDANAKPSSIADDGTIVGYAAVGGFSRNGFIVKPGSTQLASLAKEFPGIDELAVLDAGGGHTVMGISADSRYIVGFGYDENYLCVTYVLDTTGEAGISDIVTDDVTDGAAEYFSIDGRKSSTPFRGVNIVRTADGKVSKALFK